MGCADSKQQNKQQGINNLLTQEQNQRYKELDAFFKEGIKELKSFSQIPDEIIIDCFPDVKSKQEFMDNYNSELTPEEKQNILSNISQKYQKVCSLNTNFTSNNFDDQEQQLSIQDEQLLNENELKPIQNEKVKKIFNYKTTSFNKTEVAVRYSFMDKIGDYNTETGKYSSTDHKQTAYISKGVIKDDTHRTFGNIGCTGIVRDANGKEIGSISSLGVVRNAQGQTIAQWDNKDLSLGAFTYFFSDRAKQQKNQSSQRNNSLQTNTKKQVSYNNHYNNINSKCYISSSNTRTTASASQARAGSNNIRVTSTGSETRPPANNVRQTAFNNRQDFNKRSQQSGWDF